MKIQNSEFKTAFFVLWRNMPNWNFYLNNGCIWSVCDNSKPSLRVLLALFHLILRFTHEVKVKVAQLCPILGYPVERSPPDSSVHGIPQAIILEWAAMPFSRDLPNPGIKSRSPALQADSLRFELLGKPYQTPSLASNKMLQTQLEVSESLPCSGYHHLDSCCLVSMHVFILLLD